MYSSRKKFWARTALEIIAGFFLLTPPLLIFFARIIGLGYGSFSSWLFWIALVPWVPFMFVSQEELWITYPFAFVAGFFLLHTIFARECFPRCLAAARKIRPIVFLLAAGYFATGWSRFFSSGQQEVVRSDRFETYRMMIRVSGFPFRYSIDEPSFSGSSGYSVFKPGLFLVSLAFYLLVFSTCWYVARKIVRSRKI
ncbi:MAG: hypothetical protein WC866_05640 [Patescibacteria group bacterium]|jgi:hypothetical protein